MEEAPAGEQGFKRGHSVHTGGHRRAEADPQAVDGEAAAQIVHFRVGDRSTPSFHPSSAANIGVAIGLKALWPHRQLQNGNI
ncbi:MAG: hypothetical protein M0D54_17855 [Hyphomonadaceae bacterium JAD_PAG50586_4]|nr:MAG: hypothetical protein M0D54_17855 [Hyphomonadaceae bacterium JAD_PAG50586_4]